MKLSEKYMPIFLSPSIRAEETRDLESKSATVLQTRTVTGVVTDATGDPLPGVNVVVKGTSTGVVTDNTGNFSINVSGRDAVLVFSFIGNIHELKQNSSLPNHYPLG